MTTLLRKHCKYCNQEKDITEFNKAKAGKFGVRADCRACQKAYAKQYFSTPKGKQTLAKQRLKTRYNLTQEDYNQLLQKQNNCCAICKTNLVRLVIDHDHTTLEIRGLLCSQCNSMLGMAKDNINTLTNAIKYLTR